MSLYGALFSGVSGLAAQSSAMGAIADNVANVNTIGYKGTTNQFQTLITKQVSLSRYSPGGVQSKPRANIDVQGLLSSTNSSTDLSVSGQGFFVVNEAANPESGNRWAYTRAGSFKMDSFGYLTNSGGFYLQAWPLMPHDNYEGAATVVINGLSYMKAYQTTNGEKSYINDNIIDNRNLKPINLNTIGGSANPTKQIRMGANLPAGDPVFDSSNPDLGGLHNLAVLIYDSLGNPHNVNFEYTKTASTAWSVDAKMPTGAAVQVLYSNREISDEEEDVYSARAQLEFTSIPQNHSYVKLTDDYTSSGNARTFIYEFTRDGTTTYAPQPGETVVAVDISSGVIVPSDAVSILRERIMETMPTGARFSADGNTLAVRQSLGGSAVAIDVSNCLEILQSSANPDPVTGIPSGQFNLPEIDWAYKNVARLDFTSTDPNSYLAVGAGNNRTIIIDQQVYQFTSTGYPTTVTGAIAVNIDGALSGADPDDLNKTVNIQELTTALHSAISANAREPKRFVSSGTSIEIHQSTTGSEVMMNTGSNRIITFTETDPTVYYNETITLGGNTYEFVNGGAALPGNVAVDISGITMSGTAPQQIINMLKAAINATDANSAYYQTNTLQPNSQSLILPYNLADVLSLPALATDSGEINGLFAGGGVTGEAKNNGATTPVNLATSPIVISERFTFNNEPSAEDGARSPAIRFSSDGTPKYFNVQKMSIEWANGAENMTGSPDYGDKISLFMGNSNTADGMTHLSGDFIPNYLFQDGAKFGNFAGVSIGQNGIVTALFDNGDTRPIAQIPLATFTNPNGMEGLTGNAWIETDFSGMPTLRTAAQGGAGDINAATLESSTVDLGEEFSTMITTQRAYSAAAKIITTSDEMLDELIRIKR